MKLLITRPLRQAKRTASALEQLGHSTIIDPLLRVEKIVNPFPSGVFEGLILTSANALPSLSKSWPKHLNKNIPMLTTGDATCKTAATHGFPNCQSVQGSALKLVDHVFDWMTANNISKKATLLYPCAKKPAHNLEELLKLKAISCHSWPSYHTIPALNFSPETLAALTSGTLDGVLLYSRRTAKAFDGLVNSLSRPQGPIHIFALSAEIIEDLSKNPAFSCHYPQIPTEKALFGLIPSL